MRYLTLLAICALACGGERDQREREADCAVPEQVVVCGANEWEEFVAPADAACIHVDGEATLWLDVVPYECSPGQGPILVDDTYSTTARSLYAQGSACVTFPSAPDGC